MTRLSEIEARATQIRRAETLVITLTLDELDDLLGRLRGAQAELEWLASRGPEWVRVRAGEALAALEKP